MIATRAARMLAEQNKIELSSLQRRIQGQGALRVEQFISVADVQQEIQRRNKQPGRYSAAEVARMGHMALRRELKSRGIKNSFNGSSKVVLRKVLSNLLHGDPMPQQLLCVEQLRAKRRGQYSQLVHSCSLETLAVGLPEPAWHDYLQHGWLRLHLGLSAKELRMIALCHRVQLAELGVVPTDPSTYANARHVVGYDYNWGWVRVPACSQAQIYLATRERHTH